MVKRYFDFLGEEETLKLLEANEKPLLPSIRVNTLKISPLQLKERMEKNGFLLQPSEWILEGFKVLKEPLNLGSTHEYLQGYYYIQNITSMFPALILSPKPNETVIDMCSAPGGKGTHLAQIMKNEGCLLLIDRNLRRIPSLEMNVRRLGVRNSIILNHDSVYLSKLNIKADKILLDAPCTGEGLIRVDKTRKKSKKMQNLNKMNSIQMQLLRSGLHCLSSGGQLLYSTCSIAPEENELVIDEVLQNENEYNIEKISFNWGLEGLTKVFGKALDSDLRFSQRFYPHIHGTIGFYICLLSKK